MACSNCYKTSTVTPCTTGCSSTIKADCVIYDGDVLSFEEDSVESGDKRTISTLLAQIESCCGKESKIVSFNDDGETDDGDEYTVTIEDTKKVILLTQEDDGTAGTRTYTINLPQTEEFINTELEFKDITNVSSEDVVINIVFNLDIQYKWDTVQSTDVYSTLMDSKHKHLILRFVKVTPTSYQWIVCSEAEDIITQFDDLSADVTSLSGDVEDLLTTTTVNFEDVDLNNNWVTHALNVQVQKTNHLVMMRGYVVDGDNNYFVLTLPAGYTPPRLIEFTSHTSGGALVSIVINVDGKLYIDVLSEADGATISDYITLSNISFMTV